MNKHLQLPIDIELVRHPGQTVLSLSFRREALRDWCLGLCLLKEGLIETLIVAEERGKSKMIKFRATQETDRVTQVTFKPDFGQVEITRNQLGYLHRFFLKYYRDGVADVDHLDLEAINADTGEIDAYITFRVPDSRPPVSPEEVERRLRG